MEWWQIALVVVLSGLFVVIASALILWRMISNRTKKLATRIGALSWSARFELAGRVLTDGRIPLPVRLVLPLVVVYLALPVDLIPDFIPVLGQVDDIIVVLVGVALLVRLAPASVLDQHLSDLEPAIDVPSREELPRAAGS
jgi:uncharacterized membrane protein YkvA (DUF1232 family)